MIYSYPLNWPPGWERTEKPGYGGFKVDLATAEAELASELERLGATSAYLSSDNEITLNQRPKASYARTPSVVLHFVRNGSEFQIPCDRFDDLRGNVRAIGYTLANIRQMERYGTTQMLDTALAGFAALPPGGDKNDPIYQPPKPWYEVLHVDPEAPREIIDAAYKAMLRKTHPDAGGSEDEFNRVQKAYEEPEA